MGGTLAGLKQLVSYSSSSPLPPTFQRDPTSRSSETTEGLWKAGGKAEVRTDQPTTYSGTSTFSQKRKMSQSTPDTYPAKTTQLMAHLEDSTATGHVFCLQSTSPHQSDSTYATLMCLSHHLSHTLYRKERPQHPSQNPIMPCSSGKEQASQICSITTPGPCLPKHRDGMKAKHFPGMIQHMPKAGLPAHYTKDLCPLPSDCQPHVLASEDL